MYVSTHTKVLTYYVINLYDIHIWKNKLLIAYISVGWQLQILSSIYLELLYLLASYARYQMPWKGEHSIVVTLLEIRKNSMWKYEVTPGIE